MCIDAFNRCARPKMGGMNVRTMRALTAVAVMGLGLVTVSNAQAAFVATMTEVGSDVVVTGSGTINLAGFNNPYAMTGQPPSGMWASEGTILIGPPGVQNTDHYVPFSGPPSFGTGGLVVPSSSGTGDRVGVRQDPDLTAIIVPYGYVSGDPLSSSSTYANATFATLGVTPGTYVWTWGSEATADSFTLNIIEEAPAVPEPGSFALLVAGLAGLGLKRCRKGSLPPHRTPRAD